MPHRLTKSRLLSYLQCPRRLWLEVHRPELAMPDPARLARFETGNQVGTIARALYTRAAVETGASIQFEATYLHDDVLVRADVIERPGLFGPSGTRLIEVKSASGVARQHLADCAIQVAVMRGVGDAPGSVAVAHIDKQFVYAGGNDYRGLLTETDVTSQVQPIAERVPAWSRDAQVVLAGREPPIAVGTHCHTPRPCPFLAHCWPRVRYPLSSLPNVHRKLNDYVARGYRDLRDVPEEELPGNDALRVWRATRAGRAEVSADLVAWLRALPWPRYYLDFETFGPCVPVWPGTRPNQAIPYQWSVHVEPSPQGTLAHFEHLDLSGDFPARGVAESLVRALGDVGPILTYSGYERRCLRTLAALVPDLAAELSALAARIVDLLPMIRGGYYHPEMHGSWSIKSVLPAAVPDMRYEDLGEVRDGTGAERAYLEAIDARTSVLRLHEIRQRLLTYCAFDTEAMVRLVRTLSQAVGRA